MKNLLNLHRYLKEENVNEIYYYMLISEIFHTKFDYIIPNSKLSQNIVTISYIPEVTRLIFVMNKMELEYEEKKFIKWIQKSQSSDGGFGFLPYTTTFLENTCYALRGLHILNALPSNIDMCEKFVKNCRTGNGGYARKSNALGTLQATYHAICCHEIINRMKISFQNHYENKKIED
jgi:prenyltransferase beta subunit